MEPCWRGDEEPSGIRAVSLGMGSVTDNSREITPRVISERLPHPAITLERWFRVTPAILHSIDAEGRLNEVSDAWLAKFGYRREEVLGRKSSDFLTPASRDYAIREVLPEFFRAGRCDNVEYQMVCKDGRVLDVLMSAVTDPGDTEHGSCSLAVITDVTALRHAERKLVESEALYKGLIESQTELVSLAKPDGELRFVNTAYARHYDRQPHELIGTNLLDYVPQDVRGSVMEQLQKVCASEQSVESENQVVLPNGQTRWISWTNRAILDASGGVTVIHSVGRDIERRVIAEERMKASEARYRLIADNSSDLVMLTRNDGLRKYVSPSSLKILGWTPEEMLKMTPKDMMHPEDYQAAWSAHTAMGVEQVTVTYRMRRKDGAFIWVENATKKVEIAGESLHLLVVIRDIEQRIVAERSLKESEARYRLLAENSSDMVILARKDGQRRYVSPACRKLLGWTQEEMLAMTAKETIHPEDYPKTWGAQTYSLPEHVTLTYRMRRKDGAYIWVEAASQRVQIDDDVPHRLVVIRDIESRIEGEGRLKESEAAYRLLADNSSDMVFQLDRDLVLRYVSPASRDVLGNEPAEMVGLKPAEMAYPDDAERIKAAFTALVAGDAERQSPITRRQHRDGRWIWVESQMKAVRDPQTGAFCGIVGALRDITLRKSMEDQLAEANRRLQILATRDGLTGLGNRRAFDEALVREHRRATRDGECLALIMIYVDRFKSFNDCYGHPAGDECLKQVAHAIAATIRRPGDLAARYGGEEFVVLLPNTDEKGAAEVAERVRLAVSGLALEHVDAMDRIVTISAGVSATEDRTGETGPDELLRNADRALYCAKHGGRDQVVNASSLPENGTREAEAVSAAQSAL